MLNRLSRRTFCILHRRKDPKKHFYMHSTPNIHSESWAWVGRVMIPKSLAERSVSGDLESRTVTALYSYFATLNPEAKLDASNYLNDRSNSIGCLGVRPLSRSEFDGLLDFLLNHIVLPTHKYRVNIERKQRQIMHLNISSKVAVMIPTLEDEPIQNFVNFYVNQLQKSINVSHDYQDENILGSVGNMDVKPEVILEREKFERERETIGNDLQEDRKENKNWVNSMMAYLHS